MPIFIENPRAQKIPWLGIVLSVVGTTLFLLPLFVPLSNPWIAFNSVGVAMDLIAVRIFLGKVPLPRPLWVIVVGMLLIIGFKLLLDSVNPPLWIYAIIFPAIWTYAWLQSKGKVP